MCASLLQFVPGQSRKHFGTVTLRLGVIRERICQSGKVKYFLYRNAIQNNNPNQYKLLAFNSYNTMAFVEILTTKTTSHVLTTTVYVRRLVLL